MNISISALDKIPSLSEVGARVIHRYRSGTLQDLLGRVEYSLLLFEDRLIDTASGESRQLADAGTRAEAIARAAADLLPRDREAAPVLLLLPPNDFVATSYDMAVNSESMIRSALQLQAHSLIPAFEDELLLGVDARSPQGVALWYPEHRADALYDAFDQQGLFLTAVMPRTLAALGEDEASGGSLLVTDEDAGQCTVMQVEDGIIKALLTVSRRDLEQEAFARQWENTKAELRAGRTLRFAGLEDWTGLHRRVASQASYSFLPGGARQVSKGLERRKRARLGGGLAAAALLVLCLPFVMNWWQIQRLEQQVAQYREQSAEVREMQGAVLAMEEEWGAVSNYPDQNMAQVLLSLNEVIENSLTSFRVSRGVIDIQGYAQSPASLMAQLAEREEFYNVTQSQSISGGNSSNRGDRFGIRMSLRDVDFQLYENNYPATEQR